MKATQPVKVYTLRDNVCKNLHNSLHTQVAGLSEHG